jgi:putative methyltransferase (TIGR04325 family)
MAIVLKRELKILIREVTPPVVLRLLRPFRERRSPRYGYFGDYPTFDAAVADCTTDGYSNDQIVARVSEQTEEVKDRFSGQATSVLLDGRIMQNLAATLLAISSGARATLSVLDFGGGLGIHHYQMSPFLAVQSKLSWLVCETEVMVREGNRRGRSPGLQFVSSLDEAHGPFDLVLASGAIQYLPDPLETLARLAQLSDHLLLNRLPLVPSDRDRLTVHKVDPAIYPAVIPTWFLSERRWFARLEALGFEVTMRWEVPQDVLVLDGAPVVMQGLLVRRRSR